MAIKLRRQMIMLSLFYYISTLLTANDPHRRQYVMAIVKLVQNGEEIDVRGSTEEGGNLA